MTYTVQPIGHVQSPVLEPVDDVWGSIAATIHLDPAQFTPESLAGLTQFSHIEVIFLFSRVDHDEIQTKARHPRGRTDWPLTGIFAQRGKNRPNRIGTTVCRLFSVDGLAVRVEGLDAIDGTPVLDIKPYMTEFAPRGPVHQPQWSTELMANYWSGTQG